MMVFIIIYIVDINDRSVELYDNNDERIDSKSINIDNESNIDNIASYTKNMINLMCNKYIDDLQKDITHNIENDILLKYVKSEKFMKVEV